MLLVVAGIAMGRLRRMLVVGPTGDIVLEARWGSRVIRSRRLEAEGCTVRVHPVVLAGEAGWSAKRPWSAYAVVLHSGGDRLALAALPVEAECLEYVERLPAALTEVQVEAGPPLLIGGDRQVWPRPRPYGLCSQCGYDLRGLPPGHVRRCPECGTVN